MQVNLRAHTTKDGHPLTSVRARNGDFGKFAHTLGYLALMVVM
jgi:hypothetical protein